MSDRLPSLTALRAFDAAARHLSFAEAAAELNVTPAALSFQIKNLEADLGAPLFHRRTRAIDLTEAGVALAPHAARGMDALRQGWQAAQRATQGNRLTVTTAPAFTSKWLAPRMGDFARTHPEIELRLATTLKVLDFARDGIDLALRFATEMPPDQDGEPLLNEVLLPLARRDIAARVKRPEDLLHETLIADDSLRFLPRFPGWADWLAAAGIEAPVPPVTMFSQADHSLDMALQGGGVVLGRFLLAQGSLRDGTLVAPFQLGLSLSTRYWIVTPKDRPDSAPVSAFRSWLRSQAHACQSLGAGLTLVPWPPQG